MRNRKAAESLHKRRGAAKFSGSGSRSRSESVMGSAAAIKTEGAPAEDVPLAAVGSEGGAAGRLRASTERALNAQVNTNRGIEKTGK